MGTNRLESFSDGVIAVAITLLVLDITVPGDRHQTLVHGLAAAWPHYVAYAVSFLTIGIIWMNHHAMISRLREADHSILILNLLLLMSIGLLPFATSLMAEYVNRSEGESVAAAVYGGAFLFMAVTFAVLNAHIMLRRHHLMTMPMEEERRRLVLRRSIRGLGPYAAATGLAFVSPYVTLVICGALAAYYAFPLASGLDQAPAGSYDAD